LVLLRLPADPIEQATLFQAILRLPQCLLLPRPAAATSRRISSGLRARRRERRHVPGRARRQVQRSGGLARRRRMDAAWAGVAAAGDPVVASWSATRRFRVGLRASWADPPVFFSGFRPSAP